MHADDTSSDSDLNRTFFALVEQLRGGVLMGALLDRTLESAIIHSLLQNHGRMRLQDLLDRMHQSPTNDDDDRITAAIGLLAEEGEVQLEDSWIVLSQS